MTMYPPIFDAVNVPGVQALLKPGKGELRFYLFGMAPQGVQKPYAVWQTAYGSPENYLNRTPNADSFGVQVDVYADSPTSARTVAEALRNAIEPYAYITSWRGDSRDPDTKNYRFGFDCDWIVNRNGTGSGGGIAPPPASGGQGPKGDKGDPGDPGADGASAYEVAVGSGFVGTEAEWLDSLVGSAGATGATGATGPAGAAGSPGADGEDGAPGADGADGEDGKTILYGSSDPTTQGVDGDFYINTTSHYIFGPKASGTWPAGVSLIGPTGADGTDGTVITVSSTPPDDPVEGQLWVDIS